ncbi:hypothetical protein B9T21_00170 [Wohlfahrtiimonas chitiniclastica]|uniref:MetQ/NlpA family ABC transporter substrate-binding protein n=1 Tax=Wohlfahrtiimonas chitiniclastica TaxID=400946 RepID=UPI000B9884ED|nr:MetQ/NlpA family ABC transporter substrate-binding protein [Wohlfahrtiimonas chitiniclastica]OYQ89195.1 hypothetical protein B9T21_00170 [Wohlfahrtiimonas chitiniclastica]
MKALGKRLITAATLALSLILAGCGNSDTAQTSEKKTITFGTTPGMFADMVRDSVRPQLEEKGYTVKLIEFNDYVRPNHALASGDLDINIFQHQPYLTQFIAHNKVDLIPLFQVPTAPLGVYPGKLKTLEDVKEGSAISVASDPSNFSRTLVLLSQLGWITLKDDVNPITASEKDIAENPKGLKFIAIDAAQLPRSRSDVDFAVITGNYAVDAKIPLTEALFQEPSFEYINWSAIKTADQNAQWVKDVTDAYNSEAFKAYAHEVFAGYKYPAAWSATDSKE